MDFSWRYGSASTTSNDKAALANCLVDRDWLDLDSLFRLFINAQHLQQVSLVVNEHLGPPSVGISMLRE